MAKYIVLLKFTQKGIESIKDGPARLDVAKNLFRSMGSEIKEYYLTMGQYDAVVIAEAPDDEAISKLLLQVGSLGNVSTETLRAFTEADYRRMIASLP
jgi:uncharacterized protein with GYD domain